MIDFGKIGILNFSKYEIDFVVGINETQVFNLLLINIKRNYLNLFMR